MVFGSLLVSGREATCGRPATGRRCVWRSLDLFVLVDARSRRVHEVLSVTPHQVFEVTSLSRDNRTIYFAIHATEADVWLASLE
jgi:hypothetical protein